MTDRFPTTLPSALRDDGPAAHLSVLRAQIVTLRPCTRFGGVPTEPGPPEAA